MAKTEQHRCEGYDECAYWASAEYVFIGGERKWFCEQCSKLPKLDGWSKVVPLRVRYLRLAEFDDVQAATTVLTNAGYCVVGVVDVDVETARVVELEKAVPLQAVARQALDTIDARAAALQKEAGGDIEVDHHIAGLYEASTIVSDALDAALKAVASSVAVEVDKYEATLKRVVLVALEDGCTPVQDVIADELPELYRVATL